jgi:phosphonate metabolism protein (transferase hexapeptide repeat family)
MKALNEDITIYEGLIASEFTYGKWVEIGAHNTFENVYIGNFSYTGPYTIIQNTKVLNFSNIAAHVRIGATDHPLERVTMHHFTYRKKMYHLDTLDDEDFLNQRKSRMTTIGHDTWIGHGAVIKPGIHVGHGSVIGSSSVVTKDVPDYAIVVGNPAKVIRYRFNPDQIQKLLSIQWWHWSYETIKKNQEDFLLPIDDFIFKYGQSL